MALGEREPTGTISSAYASRLVRLNNDHPRMTHFDNSKLSVLGQWCTKVVGTVTESTRKIEREFKEDKSQKAHRKTQLPISSTFHAWTNATSPAIEGSSTNRFPLIAFVSLGRPGMAIPAVIPPGLYRTGIEPSSTAVEAPVGVKKAGIPAA